VNFTLQHKVIRLYELCEGSVMGGGCLTHRISQNQPLSRGAVWLTTLVAMSDLSTH